VKAATRILLLEDDVTDAELIRFELGQAGLAFTLDQVDSREGFLQHLLEQGPDLILSDYRLPGFDGLEALDLAKEKRPDTPFIFVTGTLGEERAIETLKRGASDYVLKTTLNQLGPAVLRSLREAAERMERRNAERRLRESHQQLRSLSMHLQSIREEERTRISRAVHDELGQALTGLKLDLAWLSTRLPRSQRPLLDKMRSMSQHMDELIKTVRRIATELRPGILDDIGLVAALEWQGNEFQSRTGIACHVTSTLQESVLDPDLNTAFFRIFQETLTNIIRHAQATRVDVHTTKRDGMMILTVHDNGRGIEQTEIADRKSIGLLGMEERAALLGGEFEIKGEPGNGTTVTVRIPMARRRSPGSASHEDPDRRRPRRSEARLEADPGR